MRWRYLLIPAAAVMIVSCAAQTAVRVVPEEYETDYSEVSIQILEIDVPGAKEFSDAYNAELRQNAEAAVSGFDADAKEAAGEISQKSVFQTTQDIKYNKNGFISAVEEQYTYTGGAHGMTLRKTRNIDTLAQKEITLSELFAEEGWEETLNRMIREVREKHPETYSELWAEPAIKPEQDFYITDTDLVIYYQPYELSYYAKGFVEFPLRLSELRGYMKEEYYRLIEE